MTAGLAFTGSPKISKDLDKPDPNSTVDVIVQFKSALADAHDPKVTKRGRSVKSELRLVKGGAYRASRKAPDDLANDRDVACISPGRQVKGSLDSVTPAAGVTLPRGTAPMAPASVSPRSAPAFRRRRN